MCRAELLPEVQPSSSEPWWGLPERHPNERNVQVLAGDRDVGNLLRPPGMPVDEEASSIPGRSPFGPQNVRYPLNRSSLGVRVMVDGRSVSHLTDRSMVADVPAGRTMMMMDAHTVLNVLIRRPGVLDRHPDADQSPGNA